MIEKSHKKEVIVTGVNGFVGEHVAQKLKENGYSVHGVARDLEVAEKVAPFIDSYSSADLLESEQVRSIPMHETRAIIHLAGLASVAESFDKPDLYKAANADMTRNLLQTASDQGFKGRTVVVSTGALYDPNQEMPINEASATTQGSPYATGKLRAEEVAKEFGRGGSDIVIARPFNHIGPGQEPGFLVPDLYKELQQAQANGLSEIKVGNLNTKRDYTDVRDIAEAYVSLALAPHLKYDTYNIATGASHSGLEILDLIKKAAEIDSITPVVDPARIRPTDIMDIIGDASRLKSELAWAPNSNIETAVHDFVVRQKL